MGKSNLAKKQKPDDPGMYENLELYVSRRNTLNKLVNEIQENGFTPGYIEDELISIELGDVIQELRGTPTKEALKILKTQIEKYQLLIKRLMK